MPEGDHSASDAWIAAPRPGWEQRLREKRPFLSIVTPSLNQARYLEQTINSVLSQGYDRLEYIILDGGSTDGSAEIIRRYSDRLAYWVSEPDRGQVDAINRGIQRSSGDIVAYINADDYYMPGAFAAAIDGFAAQPSAGFVYGSAVAIDEQEREIVKMPARDFDLDAFVFGAMYVAQAAAFMSRQALFEVGPFSADLDYVFDWDMFIRIARRMPGVSVPAWVAVIRDYATTKTNTGGFDRAEQIRRLVQRHSGQPFTVGYLHYYMWDLQRALASLNIPEDARLHWEVRQLQIALGQMIAEDQFLHRVGANMPAARLAEREKQLLAQVIERDTEIFRLQRVVSEAVAVRDAEIRRLQSVLGDTRARAIYCLRSWLASALRRLGLLRSRRP
ncbi:MAG TPA: glycosyltransferase family 2 protein [Thermoanaerobaculia bacterium]|nr:glycosyltransferase family 2 protein [Thermoanaerobaculia bacterium]